MLASRRTVVMFDADGPARAVLLLLSLVALWWSTTVLPTARFTASALNLTERIMADERFKRGPLSEILAQIESAARGVVAQASVSRAQALIRIELAEKAMQQKGADEVDRETIAAEGNVKSSLALNPADSFLWMLLYSIATTRNGFDPIHIKYIEQSYQSGPREGWVALRRNPLALAAFPLLDVSLRRMAVTEFAQIVDADLTNEAALILEGTGWTHRDALLAALSQADFVSRLNLYKRLSQDGLKLQITGIPYDERPWR